MELAHQIAAFPQVAMRSDRMSAIRQWNLSEQDAIALETRVGGEDHVWGTGLRFDQDDGGYLRDCCVELLPLRGCAFARRGVDVADHPGVDDVIDLVEPGGTHEEGRHSGADSCADRGNCENRLKRLGAHLECVSLRSMEDHKTRVNTNDYAFLVHKDARSFKVIQVKFTTRLSGFESLIFTGCRVDPVLFRLLRRGL